MAARAWFRRAKDWTIGHPWLTMFAWAATLTVIFWLLPPRTSLSETALRVGIAMIGVLGLNVLLYRSFFPTKQRIREEEAKADEIAASVRRWREHDSRL
jgi:CHASE2 domain-containing sensor protein